MSQRFPQHKPLMTPATIQEIYQKYSETALDYGAQLKFMGREWDEKRRIQLLADLRRKGEIEKADILEEQAAIKGGKLYMSRYEKGCDDGTVTRGETVLQLPWSVHKENDAMEEMKAEARRAE